MHAAMSMAMEEEMDSAMAAKLLADKRESEFNHHLAGFFVVLAGLFIWRKPISATWPSFATHGLSASFFRVSLS